MEVRITIKEVFDYSILTEIRTDDYAMNEEQLIMLLSSYFRDLAPELLYVKYDESKRLLYKVKEVLISGKDCIVYTEERTDKRRLMDEKGEYYLAALMDIFNLYNKPKDFKITHSY